MNNTNNAMTDNDYQISYGFTNLTPNGCPEGSNPIFALPGTYDGEIGIDACIIKQAKGMDPIKDKAKILGLVQENCTNASESLPDHRLYCAPKLTRELLWDGGACQDSNGYPKLSSDGELVCQGGWEYVPSCQFCL